MVILSKKEIEYTNMISLANVKSDGTKFQDGFYQMKVTPIIKLSETERKELTALRAAGDDEKIAAYRLAHDLPAKVDIYNINFSIRNGQFVSPDQKEYRKLPKASTALYMGQEDDPSLYASLNPMSIDYGQPLKINDLTPAGDHSMAEDAQVFVDDIIVQGSACVGFDCSSSENFGFDTQRLKENNLRIHFDDTSASGSFPSNDWRISINSSDNGGANYFAIEDATANTTPFRVMAGAGNNAIYVSNSGGNVGMGNANPVVELHVTDGDSPTMRLEQDGANGWTPQTWDIAGNETNFFIRDVTNGSKLPFKIKPGAPDNSIYIDAEGDIGLGTANPGTNALQVESGNVYLKAGNIGINKAPSTYALDVLGNAQFEGTTLYKGDVSYFLTNGTSFLTPTFTTALRIDAVNGRVGIGTATPSYELEVCGTIATTAAQVTTGITCSSDKRFKKNIETLTGSLDKIINLRGVSYDWRIADFPEKHFNEAHQIGFIAQEIETLLPELVNTDDKGYKSVDYSKITPVLVEAIKEQQQIIDQQQAELNELRELKSTVAALSEMVAELNKTGSNNEAVGKE